MEESKPKKKKLTSDSEVEAMLKRMHLMKNNLGEKWHESIENTGFTREQMLLFIEKPPPVVEEEITKRERELEAKIVQVLGKTHAKYTKIKKQKKMTKELRGKTIGGRKRWLRM